ncbi:MAG: hypothetical protein HDR01_12210 [Lachnospiraceae bacterium]|nr:hypothetical protein [Lachnospiraceae bacterium]
MSKTKAKLYQSYYVKIVDALSKIDYSLGEKYKNALNMHMDLVKPVIDRMSSANGVAFPSENEAGKIFADFRNGIAHGNPPEREKIHCVLFEVARAFQSYTDLHRLGHNIAGKPWNYYGLDY